MATENYQDNLFEKKRPWTRLLKLINVLLLTGMGVGILIVFLNPPQVISKVSNVIARFSSEQTITPNTQNNVIKTGMIELTALTDSSLEEELFPRENAPVVPLVVEEKKKVVEQPIDQNLSREQRIQSILKRNGFYKGNIDGKIGPMTIEAIKRFQKSRGLKVDGVVGEKTWQTLLKYEGGIKR